MDEERLATWIDGYLTGYDRGYWVRVAEENELWPPESVYSFGKWYDQALEREKADRR